MRIIETKIKNAFDQYRKDGDLLKFTKDIAHVGDYSVNSQTQAAIMYDAIREHCPKLLYECVFYDGENGGNYHLLDFDPNQLKGDALIAAVKISLQHQCHVDPCDVDQFMNSVYLIDTNAMIKVVTE